MAAFAVGSLFRHVCRLLFSNTQYPDQQTIARANGHSYQNLNNLLSALSLLTLYRFSRALLFCSAAQFLRSLRPNPGPIPRDTKVSGKHNPRRAEFYLLQPFSAEPQTARTAGRSGRAGEFTPLALSPAFFHTGPAPSSKPAAVPNLPQKPLLGQLPYPALQAATQRPTGANSGDTAGAAFFFVLCVSF